jgi:hypothetical protein
MRYLDKSLGLYIVPRFLEEKLREWAWTEKADLYLALLYVIRRGTDLSSLGVSLIFDNATNGHLSLIPNKRNAPSGGVWGVHDPHRT